ncbi:MAG: hypothetical protein ABSG68_04900 [Thermoguttaceae bacterium]|jgi:hypothetical protein
MNCKTCWLAAAALCALGAAPPSADTDTKIFVIQPGTERLVGRAEMAIYSTGDSPRLLDRQLTGLHGEPIDLPRFDPALGRLRIVVGKRGASGALDLTYDSDTTLWNRPYKEPGWRPAVIYDNRRASDHQWRGTEYAAWKKALVDWRASAVALERALKGICEKPQDDPQLPQMIRRALGLIGDMETEGDIHGFLIDAESGKPTDIAKTLRTIRDDLGELPAAPAAPAAPGGATRAFSEILVNLADYADQLLGERNRTVYPPDGSVLLDRTINLPVVGDCHACEEGLGISN